MVQNGWIMFLFSLTPPKKFQTCSERQKRIMRERMKKRKIRRMRKFKTRLLKWTSTEGRRCFWDTEPQVARVWVSSTWEVLATWQAHYRLCITLHRWQTTCGSVITKKSVLEENLASSALSCPICASQPTSTPLWSLSSCGESLRPSQASSDSWDKKMLMSTLDACSKFWGGILLKLSCPRWSLKGAGSQHL